MASPNIQYGIMANSIFPECDELRVIGIVVVEEGLRKYVREATGMPVEIVTELANCALDKAKWKCTNGNAIYEDTLKLHADHTSSVDAIELVSKGKVVFRFKPTFNVGTIVAGDTITLNGLNIEVS